MDAVAMSKPIPDEQLLAWLRSTFVGGDLSLLSREPMGSFQQHLEKLIIHHSLGSETVTSIVYLRIYRGYFSWWTLETPDLPLREQAAWRVAERAGLPIPPLLCSSYSDALDVALHREVPGVVTWNHLNAEVVERLALLLARMHTTPVNPEDREHLPDITLPAQLDRFRSWSSEAGAMDLLQELETLSERFSSMMQLPSVFLHGDCHFGNILSDGKRITAVLDWEEAAIGDPHVDLSTVLWCLNQREAGELADHFIAVYGRESGHEVQDLTAWAELLSLRNRLVSAWMKWRIRSDLPPPRTNAHSWIGE